MGGVGGLGGHCGRRDAEGGDEQRWKGDGARDMGKAAGEMVSEEGGGGGGGGGGGSGEGGGVGRCSRCPAGKSQKRKERVKRKPEANGKATLRAGDGEPLGVFKAPCVVCHVSRGCARTGRYARVIAR